MGSSSGTVWAWMIPPELGYRLGVQEDSVHSFCCHYRHLQSLHTQNKSVGYTAGYIRLAMFFKQAEKMKRIKSVTWVQFANVVSVIMLI